MAVALFVLATDVWASAPLGVWCFVGAVLLGVIGPLGTWAIIKHYPEPDWLAWRLMAIAEGVVAIFALHRLVAFSHVRHDFTLWTHN